MNKRRASNRIAHREPEHHEQGFRARNQTHQTQKSPASKGAYKGTGMMPGTDELLGPGPGAAAKGYASRDMDETPVRETPSGKAPAGMKVYREE